MIINNNISALNTHRQMGMNQQANANSMEKLSSGLRINRAGDDAAGLAISEKMRAQITGLDQASRNAQDGISMIQTAEGALNETHDILQRMRELAVQSANDTNTDADRDELQKEVNQLAEEITRIGETTEFNTQNLLNGDLDVNFHIGANEGQNLNVSVADMRADALGVAGNQAAGFDKTVAITDAGEFNPLEDGATYKAISIEDYNGEALNIANSESGDIADISHVLVDSNGNAIATSEDGAEFHAYGATSDDRATFDFGDEVSEVTISGTDAIGKVAITDHELSTGTYEIADLSDHGIYGGDWEVGLKDASGNIVALGATGTGGSGDSAATAGAVTHWVDVNDTSSALLEQSANAGFGFGDTITVTGAGIDISSQASADAAITTINDAIESVSAQRSELGAFQNRLEHTINNLGTSAENLQAAESRIRDVDMAAEMMEMTRSNILSQASQSMLAQANQQPQSVLQLLG